MKHGIQLLGVGAVALLALTGCSAPAPGPSPATASGPLATASGPTEQQGTAPAPSTAPTTTAMQESDPAGTPTSIDAPGATEAPSVASLGTALLTQEFTVPGTKNKVEASIYSLKVHGEVMELTMTVTPHFAKAPADKPLSYWTVLNETSEGPKLIDRTHLKEYRTVKEPSSSGLSTLNNTPMLWVGWYAAPQDHIDTIDIKMMDGVPNFQNVPVTR